MVRNMKETAKKAGKVAVEAITVDNLMKIIKSELGQKAIEKITGKIFGIGPDDEALLEKAINFLIFEINEIEKGNGVLIARVRGKISGFLDYLEENGYSRWWFRNVLATMRKGDASGENQAAQTLHTILQGRTFEEMKTLAGPHLIQKTYFKKASEGWELVANKAGGLNLLVKTDKVKNFLKSQAEEFEAGLVQPLIPNFKIKCWVIGGIIIFWIIIFCFFYNI